MRPKQSKIHFVAIVNYLSVPYGMRGFPYCNQGLEGQRKRMELKDFLAHFRSFGFLTNLFKIAVGIEVGLEDFATSVEYELNESSNDEQLSWKLQKVGRLKFGTQVGDDDDVQCTFPEWTRPKEWKNFMSVFLCEKFEESISSHFVKH